MAVLKFLLPQGFDAEAIVPPMKVDAAKWLISTVLRKLTTKDVDARGFAMLSATILQRVMGDGYAKIVRSLIDAGVLLRSPYREGRSFGYRLTDEYLAGSPRLMPVTNLVIRDRLERECQRHNAEQAERRLPIHDALDEAQQGMTIQPTAHAAVELLPAKSRLCQRVHIGRFERRELPLSISSTGRVFNGLSGVKSDLRKFLQLDGEPIGCIDIRNSQPALLGNLLLTGIPRQRAKGSLNIKIHRAAPALSCPSSSSLPVLSPAAVGSFSALASSGELYDELAALCAHDRNFVKRRLLVDVLAKRGCYPSEVERVFRGKFPEIWEAIQEINRGSHCNLIRLLQRAEAWFVVENVSPKLVERIPIVTLHDAIFARVSDLGIIEGAFHAVLDDIGWRLALKAERPDPPLNPTANSPPNPVPVPADCPTSNPTRVPEVPTQPRDQEHVT